MPTDPFRQTDDVGDLTAAGEALKGLGVNAKEASPSPACVVNRSHLTNTSTCEHMESSASPLSRSHPTEGASVIEALRRDLKLAAEDTEYLDSLNRPWETICEPNGTLLLIIDGWAIPAGYNITVAKLALVIPTSYQDTQIDMAYFSPALARRDGKQINNLTPVRWQAGAFQQWSRHRTSTNPWHSGIEQLARLGVGGFVLVDPGHVEHKNLNRILNATWEDAERETTKVEVCRRTIDSLGRGQRTV